MAFFASRSVPLDPAITEWTARSCAGDQPILVAAMDVMRRIHDEFAYEPGATSVTTLPAESFTARSGVCQDFAHVMIAGLRGLGLPARYVSGYLRTIPPEGQPRLAGRMPPMPGWRCGAARISAGSALIPPTPFPPARTM